MSHEKFIKKDIYFFKQIKMKMKSFFLNHICDFEAKIISNLSKRKQRVFWVFYCFLFFDE